MCLWAQHATRHLKGWRHKKSQLSGSASAEELVAEPSAMQGSVRGQASMCDAGVTRTGPSLNSNSAITTKT